MHRDKRQNNVVCKVFETEWFSIDALTSESISEKPYYRLSCNDSVSILTKTTNEKIILIRQFRHAIGGYTLELPSGYVDNNESPEEAVKRELTEETGFSCKSVKFLGSYRICPSRINNYLHFFYGKCAEFTNKERNKDSEVEVVLVTEDEFRRMIFEGEYTEVSGIASLLIAKLKGYL